MADRIVYCVCLFDGRTYWSTVYALVVEKSLLQRDLLRSDLLPCHVLSA